MVGCVGKISWGMGCCGCWLILGEVGYGDVALKWKGVGLGDAELL